MTDKPHNNFFVTVFSNRENMVDLLTQLLPEVADDIKIDSLQIDETSYIDEKLQDLYSDIVYSCESNNGTKTKISLLFEHKSYAVQYPTLQLADYIFSILRNNVKNKEPLSLVIPIIFYHGEKPWKYQDLKSHYSGIESKFERYIPNFDYHVIDLTQYSDEYILSLRMSFLINSLLAFKHKNDSEYVKQKPERIFHRLELYQNEGATQLFIRSLTVYILSSTNLTRQEMGQIIDTLPKEGKGRIKTTYENIFDDGVEKGLEKGISIGEKRGEALSKMRITINAIKKGADTSFIFNFLDMPKRLVACIQKSVKDDFKTEAFSILLADEILRTFPQLSVQDVVNFTALDIALVEKLKEEISDVED
jgi:predicted transposase/invertase (TIGR01784 family)